MLYFIMMIMMQLQKFLNFIIFIENVYSVLYFVLSFSVLFVWNKLLTDFFDLLIFFRGFSPHWHRHIFIFSCSDTRRVVKNVGLGVDQVIM